MDHYIDIKLLPDAEIPATVLMNAIYAKLHKALCDIGSKVMGVSFPKYKVTLGNVLRIHSATSDLNNLQGINWLGGMNGYCNVSEITPIPADTQFRTVSRKQTTMSQAKLKRLVKRGSIPEDEIKQYKAKMFTKGLDNPYVELVSGSNGQKHRRYIEFGELLDNPVDGEFDQFGLSKTATVPWF
jgi:CRISPR-associated endonuclease Csy4